MPSPSAASPNLWLRGYDGTPEMRARGKGERRSTYTSTVKPLLLDESEQLALSRPPTGRRPGNRRHAYGREVDQPALRQQKVRVNVPMEIATVTKNLSPGPVRLNTDRSAGDMEDGVDLIGLG